MSPERDGQPVQLRLGFQRPQAPASLHLSCAGATVLVDEETGRIDDAFAHLGAVGVAASMRTGVGLSFPAADLHRLVALPAIVRVRADEALAPLWALAKHPGDEDLPATLTVEPNGHLRLSWFDGDRHWDEPFSPLGAPTLLASDLAFVATPEAWEILKASCSLPVLAGRARVNLDGYVEITTSRPQLVEAAPLPGLFRIDESHFGIALKYAGAVDDAPGFIWEGHRPARERPPSHLPPMPIDLSSHLEADLLDLVENLAGARAEAVVWEEGMGRRLLVLCAIEALDAWPAVIVCPPWGVWSWQRNLDLVGRSYALVHSRADALLVTYRDLGARVDVPEVGAVVFDDLASSEATSTIARRGLRRLDSVLDAYRIGVSSRWPENLEAQVEAMASLRPGEFRTDIPLSMRYPGRVQERALEHLDAYMSRRRRSDPGYDPSVFRRSGVVVVSPSPDQLRELESLAQRRGPDLAPALAEALEIVSAGPAHATSPKISVAIALAQEAVRAGRRVVVVTRHARSATLLAAGLRGFGVRRLETDTGVVADGDAPVVLRYERQIPDLRAFSEVIVVDYPWSMTTLERAVGPADIVDGPERISVLHASGTLDDRLALLAARRRELRAVLDADSPPNGDEISYLLTPR